MNRRVLSLYWFEKKNSQHENFWNLKKILKMAVKDLWNIERNNEVCECIAVYYFEVKSVKMGHNLNEMSQNWKDCLRLRSRLILLNSLDFGSNAMTLFSMGFVRSCLVYWNKPQALWTCNLIGPLSHLFLFENFSEKVFLSAN